MKCINRMGIVIFSSFPQTLGRTGVSPVLPGVFVFHINYPGFHKFVDIIMG